ncbi:MAG: hypothetical protein ACRC1H_01105 [Caldilineaceae bacterium]
MTPYHRLQIEDFITAVRTGRPSLAPGAEGRKTVALFDAINTAQRTGHPVCCTP